jgi:hypothetical protein
MSKVDKNLLETLDPEKFYDFLLSNKLQDDIETAEILMQYLEDKDSTVGTKAGYMLSLCQHFALSPVVRKLSRGKTAWNYQLISIAWSIALNSEYKYYYEMFTDAITFITPILDDISIPENKNDKHIEREYQQFRICDEAYLLVAYLDTEFIYNEMLFWDLDYDERTIEIKLLKDRLRRVNDRLLNV